jgi:hypothetical protein
MDSNKKFFVVSSLTGTDRDEVLDQTQKLPPPVPSKGSPAYQSFLTDFMNSPANVISSIAEFLRNRAGWDIASTDNYQAYLNLFNDAPFLSGTGSGITAVSQRANSVRSLLSEILSSAVVPKIKQSKIVDDFGLDNWLKEGFEDDPKSLTIITQNLQSSDGQLILIDSKSELTISYFPPERGGLFDRDHSPTYKLEGQVATVTLTASTPSYFKDNGEQFLALGLTNVTDWIKSTSTPKPVVST